MSPTKRIGVFSVKGGTGKTTIACGLAQGLKEIGFKVGVLDADWTGPTVPTALGITEKPKRAKGNKVVPVDWNGIKVLSWGMIWPEYTPILIDDSQLDSEDLDLAINLIKKGDIEKAIKYLTLLRDETPGAIRHIRLLLDTDAIEWGDLDYLVIDTAPTSGGPIREVAGSNIWGGLLVTIPSSLSLVDLKRTIGLFKKKRVPLLGMICNMGGRDLFDLSDSEVEKFAIDNSIPFLGVIPFSKDLPPYFTALAKTISTLSPIPFKEEVYDREGMKALKYLADLMEVFRRKG